MSGPERPAPDAATRGALVAERLERVRARLAALGAGGVLLDRRRDAAWLTVGAELHVVQGGDEVAAPILVTPREAVVVAPNNEAARVVDEETGGLGLELEVVPWHEPGATAALVRRLAGDGVVRGAEVEAVTGDLRPRLHPLEHDRLRWLATAAGIALDGATAAMLPGRTESEIAASLTGPLVGAGIRVPVVLCAVDERLAYRHPLPREGRLADRCMLILVAERWGLHVAATRMAWLASPDGSPHPADATAGSVLAAMTAATRAGATLGDVLAAAAAAYERAGLPGEWRRHHQGGTIGYGPRERIATPGDATGLEAGMAVAWNPSVPGGKAEATLLVTDGAPETLIA